MHLPAMWMQLGPERWRDQYTAGPQGSKVGQVLRPHGGYAYSRKLAIVCCRLFEASTSRVTDQQLSRVNCERAVSGFPPL